MEIVILPDWSKEGSFEMAKEIGEWLKNQSFSPTWTYGDEPEPEFAILLGGDGFIMRTSRELANYDIPVMAMNFGTLGFLAVAERDNWQEVLEKVIEGRYSIERHPLLRAEHQGSSIGRYFEAVGNVYIRHQARMVVFDVIADGEIAYERIRGDGVIVANPIGSTAYNLSAGGPVIKEGIVITPICTHPRRLKSKRRKKFKEIKIIYQGVKGGQKDEGCLLFIDSDDYPIQPGDQIRISKSSKQASLIIPEGCSFAKARKEKLGLST